MRVSSAKKWSIGLAILPAFLLLPTSYAAADLIAHYKFDDGSGQTAADETGHYDGTLGANSGSGTDDPTWTTGKFGGALDFDGGDYVGIGAPIIPASGPFTIVGWGKTGTEHSGAMIGQGGSDPGRFIVYYNRAGVDVARLYFDSSQAVGSTDTSDGQWHHVAVTRSSANRFDLYVDGVSEANVSKSTDVRTTENTFLGANTSTDWRFNGILDDVAVFDAVLTDNAIGLISQNGVQAYVASMTGKLLYRETFPHVGTGGNRDFPVEGWKAHFDIGSESADGRTEIARQEGARPLQPWNSSPEFTVTDPLPGYVFRSSAGDAAGGKDFLYWTEEYTVGNVDDLHLVRWHQANSSNSDEFQVALRLDAGTSGDTSDDQWFASIETFTNLTALEHYTNGAGALWRLNRLLMEGAEWQSLDFSPGSSLELVSGVAPLPSGEGVTAFGLYSPHVTNSQRFDNFELHGVPEPGTFALAALGLFGLLLAARRRK